MKRKIFRFLVNFRYAFRPRKPALIARLIATFLGIAVAGRRPLRYVDLAIDYGCNMRCEHCFAVALEKKERPFISPEEFAVVTAEAMWMGAVNFSFQGGEPTLFPKLFDYIKACQPWKNLVSVTTNGTLLDEDVIRRLKTAGVDIVTVSLDSGMPKEHDAFRRMEGAFQKTVLGIERALKHGLMVTIGATVSHASLRSKGFTELLELSRRLNVIIFIALAAPLGRWSEARDILITEEDKRYINELTRRYPLLRTDFEANYVRWGCGAVKEILYITAYGDVLACPFLHFSLGNVKRERLTDIRDRALRYGFFNEYRTLCLAAEDKEFMQRMSGCAFYTKDGSPVTVEQIFGDWNENL